MTFPSQLQPGPSLAAGMVALFVFQPLMIPGSATLPRRTPGDPIPEIDVTVEQHPGPRIVHLHTDANGAFTFTAPGGAYLLRIAAAPTPNAATSRAAPAPAPAPGAALAPLLTLPAPVLARGGWPYRIRLTQQNVTIGQVALAARAETSGARVTTPPASQGLEIQFTLGAASGTAGSYTLHGRIEARQ